MTTQDNGGMPDEILARYLTTGKHGMVCEKVGMYHGRGGLNAKKTKYTRTDITAALEAAGAIVQTDAAPAVKGWRTDDIVKFAEHVQILCQSSTRSPNRTIDKIWEFCNEVIKTAPQSTGNQEKALSGSNTTRGDDSIEDLKHDLTHQYKLNVELVNENETLLEALRKSEVQRLMAQATRGGDRTGE